MRELIGLCMWCGCPVYSDGPVDFDNVWCNHEIFNGEEVRKVEDYEEGRAVSKGKADHAVRANRGGQNNEHTPNCSGSVDVYPNRAQEPETIT